MCVGNCNCHCLFLISSAFSASGRLCFTILCVTLFIFSELLSSQYSMTYQQVITSQSFPDGRGTGANVAILENCC